MKLQVILFVVMLTATAIYVPSSPGAVADSVKLPPSVVAGEQVYAKCMGCHSPDRNRTGPRHCGLVGRQSGSLTGYPYSEAMKASKLRWTTETLNAFLQSPMTMVPGTTMGFAGIADPVERRNLIAWLATLTEDSPLCKPLHPASGSK